jgi:hypothetical protein
MEKVITRIVNSIKIGDIKKIIHQNISDKTLEDIKEIKQMNEIILSYFAPEVRDFCNERLICEICYEDNDKYIIFDKCCHVMNMCGECTSYMTDVCPKCRTAKNTIKKCYTS